MDRKDRDLGMDCDITRRDFLNGMSVALSGSLLFPSALVALDGEGKGRRTPRQQEEGFYPPARTGMRGSHPGSFEVAHQMRDGASWWEDIGSEADTGETYDLVVVGGGISGLAAAYFFRDAAGPEAKILVLDNHDDFGGHAKRNEFEHEGRTIIVNGGALNVEAPSNYSVVATELLEEIGIDLGRYREKTQRFSNYHENQGLDSAFYFDRETFGEDKLVPQPDYMAWPDFLAQTPLSDEVQREIARLYDDEAGEDYMPGLSDSEKKARLANMSYRDFLLDYADVDPGVILFFQARPHFRFYMGPEAVPALFCWRMGYPGFQGMDLRPGPDIGPLYDIAGSQHGRELEVHEPSIYFPDGNATIARLIIRALIPEALPGSSLEDSVTARLDYNRLDAPSSAARIRLNSTVVDVRHAGDPGSASEVEVTYVRDGDAHRVRAGHCVLACWHTVIPYLCEELPEKQKDALSYGIKAPRVYTNVLIRNSRAFSRLGIRSIHSPGCYHSTTSLQMPLGVGDYHAPMSPEEPIVIRMHRAPCKPGAPRREQLRAGRYDLLRTSFETFERKIRAQLGRMLSGGGFDPARDIAGITVNRWPHGNAYAYGTLSEPDHWALYPADDRPCVIARQPFGRISIANSDAAASPFTDAAIDQAHRAVREVLLSRYQAKKS